MTLPSTVSRSDAVGNGVTTVFPYTFRVIAQTDLVVTQKLLGAVETTLVLTTNYTVDGVGNATGGNVTIIVPPPTDAIITIKRKRPLTQDTNLENQGPYLPDIHEKQFDSDAMVHQQLQEQIDRSLRLPETEVGTAALTVLPAQVDRLGQLLGFDANGNLITRSEGPAPAEVMWTVRGLASLSDNPFPRYTARKDITFAKFDITVVGFGVGGNSVINILRNGGTVATITLPAGVAFASTTINVALVDGDTIFPDWVSIAPTLPPDTITIVART